MGKGIGGITIKGYQEMETSRGVSYIGTLICEEVPIGYFENKGDGSATILNIQPEHRKMFMETATEYFNKELKWSLDGVHEYQMNNTFIEHLIDIETTGIVSADWLALGFIV